MDFLNAIVALLNFVIVPATAYGAQLALGALGVTLIYGILRFSNFAHGDTMAFGTMITILATWGLQSLGVTAGPLPTALIALPLGIAATAALVVGTDKMVYRFYRQTKAKPVIFVIASIGVMFVMNGIVRFIIGVDDQNPAEILPAFLEQMAEAGVRRLTIHARKAWLEGLSPKENRTIPPLDYALVRRMKEEFPNLHLSINGGVEDLDAVASHLRDGLDGVMVGRAAYHSPYVILGHADAVIFDDPRTVLSAHEVAEAMIPYAERHIAQGGRLHHVTRHILGLFAGQPGARAWRRIWRPCMAARPRRWFLLATG